ncbi:uncharacterized protein BDZ99DRAFT_1254 [Mytilinidion resinicola]|uniref:Uncharacterized protein n=1 Tax=Mytilinidion resinicola TaxID=574789 RepID=A0A6A6Z908_9PEZI|nr:uncharacterized protein BDZ99DRAFT_1254 [Mytilinidion resinicola]KAF2816774.1 hypothetical protein BDZ99DRAFT_1254 [Mytilinidion resinicola]
MSLTMSRPPAKLRPDISLFRTKLVLQCEPICPRQIFLDVTRARPTASQEIWIRDEFQLSAGFGQATLADSPTPPPGPVRVGKTGHDEVKPSEARMRDRSGHALERRLKSVENDGADVVKRKERFVVMDSLTWRFKKIGTRAEAMALANNPGIECGNAVWLFLDDRIDRSLKIAMNRELGPASKTARLGKLFGYPIGADVFATERQKMQALRKQIGIGEDVPEGTVMFLHIYEAILKVKEHEEKKRRLRQMMED